MPQIFQVLRCYECQCFQVHQVKKARKFQCKLCGEKQSVKRRYGIGTAKDCRKHVQKLNVLRAAIDNFKESEHLNADTDDDFDEIDVEVKAENKKPNKSKWTDFIATSECANETRVQESMYLNDTEVVLEVSKKRKKTFKCPVQKINSPCDDFDPIDTHNIQDISNMIDSLPRYQENVAGVIHKSTMPVIPKAMSKVQKSVATISTFKQNYLNTQDEEFQIKKDVDLQFPNTAIKTDPVNVDKTKAFVSTEVNSNSKWAQFITEEEGLESGQKYEHGEDDSDYTAHSQKMFALCDDNDLDSVLDI